MENIFLKAARKKYRFKTSKGMLNVEQLFDLPKTHLDRLYISLRSQNKQEVEGLIGKKSNTENDVKLEIIKNVFETLTSEQENREELVDKKARKEKILEAIERKEEKELIDDKSLDELKKMAKEM